MLIGTLAARDPDAVAALAAEHGPRICVCADALDGTVRVAGWREDAGESASAFVERFAPRGVGAFLVTAIERDGTLAGPDLRLLAGVRAVTDAVLLAAGGFASLEHVAAARDAGCDGAVSAAPSTTARSTWRGRAPLDDSSARSGPHRIDPHHADDRSTAFAGRLRG